MLFCGLLMLAARPDGRRDVLPRPGLAVHRPVDRTGTSISRGTDDLDQTRDCSAPDGRSAVRCSASPPAGPPSSRCARSAASSKGAVLDLGDPANYPSGTATYVIEGRLFVANAGGHLLRPLAEVPPPRLPGAVLRLLGTVRVPMPRLEVRPRRRVDPRVQHPGAWTATNLSLQNGMLLVDTSKLTAGPDRGAHQYPHPGQGPGLHQEPTMPRERPPRRRLRARRAGTQPRPLPHLGARLHGGADRRVRRLPGAGADAARRRRPRSSRPPTARSARSCSRRTARPATARRATGGSAPMLNAKEFLRATTDDQIRPLIAGGVSGTDMPPWSLDVRWHPHRRADPPARHLPPLPAIQRTRRPQLATRQTLSRLVVGWRLGAGPRACRVRTAPAGWPARGRAGR